ncbi:MAG TPA: nicotinate phosphoribosyltransferase, partial [Telluria sp.]|nr:nicotinate phosphoribosyltransferase [Telluria sp.]
LLRVSAPIAQAQFAESRIINLLHYQTMVATKAARCVQAAAGRELVDFGLRRSHGAEAGLLSARASYLAGFHGSATTLAGMRYGIPVSGTMAHSFVQAHESEGAAFRAFCRVFPGQATLLIDTYDIDAATREVVELSAELRAAGQPPVAAVRIDSGDLAVQARRVRALLDDGGCRHIRIVASGNLDEYAIARLAGQGVPIDVYGVGTRMNTAADAPYLDCAYKLVEYAGQPRRKRSEKKATWPGRKQVWRELDHAGHIAGDTLALAGETMPGRPLLQPVLRAGRLCAPLPPLERIRETVRRELASLPPALCTLEPVDPLLPEPSAALRALTAQLDARQAAARH